MYDYEVALIIRPEVEDEGQEAIIERLSQILTADGGQVANVETWGRRRLAYPINKQRDGYYALYEVELPPTAPPEIERNLQIAENILRYLIVRADE